MLCRSCLSSNMYCTSLFYSSKLHILVLIHNMKSNMALCRIFIITTCCSFSKWHLLSPCLCQLGMGIFQVGFVVMYLSDTLVSGFTTAAAVHIFVSQLKFVLGLTVDGFSGPLAIIYVSKAIKLPMQQFSWFWSRNNIRFWGGRKKLGCINFVLGSNVRI